MESSNYKTLTQHSYIYFELKETAIPKWEEKRTTVNDWSSFGAKIKKEQRD